MTDRDDGRPKLAALRFLQRNTGLAGGPEDSADGHSLARDLAWYPWLGLAVGLLTAGFFLPLGIIALPPHIAILLAMLWQCTLVGFRGERALFAASSQLAPQASARQSALLVLLLLLKFSVLGQFFPQEASRLLICSGITLYCIPVLCAPSVSAASGMPLRLPLPVVLQALVVWLAALVWLCSPQVLEGEFAPSAMRPVVVVAIAGTFSWLLMLDGKRRLALPPGPLRSEIFAGSLAADCAVLTALLAARNVML